MLVFEWKTRDKKIKEWRQEKKLVLLLQKKKLGK